MMGKVVFLISLMLLLVSFASAEVTRSMVPDNFMPGAEITVTLTVDFDPGTVETYIISEVYPAGWEVRNAGGLGTKDSGKLKKVVLDPVPMTTYSYTLVAPDVTEGTFSGTYSFGDNFVPIEGQSGILLAQTGTTIKTDRPQDKMPGAGTSGSTGGSSGGGGGPAVSSESYQLILLKARISFVLDKDYRPDEDDGLDFKGYKYSDNNISRVSQIAKALREYFKATS